MSELEHSITQVLEAYKSAVYARDADAFMRLYDPKVRVFDTWGIWSYEGAAAWRTAIEGWFSSLGTERVKVSFDDVDVLEAGRVHRQHTGHTEQHQRQQQRPVEATEHRAHALPDRGLVEDGAHGRSSANDRTAGTAGAMASSTAWPAFTCPRL